jgi:hypothetical protein
MKTRDYPPGRSGLRGASPLKNGKFASYIKRDGQTHYLGQHDTKEEAHAAFLEAEKRMPRTPHRSWAERTGQHFKSRNAAIKAGLYK